MRPAEAHYQSAAGFHPAPHLASALRTFRPHDALILLRDRRHPLVQKLLDALAAVGLGREDVAFRIRGDAVDGVEFAGLTAAIAEAGEDLHGVALDDVHLLVRPIGEI